jgi:hypothetical protein
MASFHPDFFFSDTVIIIVSTVSCCTCRQLQHIHRMHQFSEHRLHLPSQ